MLDVSRNGEARRRKFASVEKNVSGHRVGDKVSVLGEVADEPVASP